MEVYSRVKSLILHRLPGGRWSPLSLPLSRCVAKKIRGIYSPTRQLVPVHPGSRRGFTIVELLIVIVVIAILAAISIVAYTGIQNSARDSAVANKDSQVIKRLEAHKVEKGQYPSDQSEFDQLVGQNPSDNYYTTYSSAPPHDTYSISTSGGSTVALNCPTGFIVVPGNSTYGTSDFCVMKYEAKNVGGVATSQASGTPWVNISQPDAITAAQTACDGCQLITEAQWMTIAMNVISVGSNWSTGTVGSGFIYSGHNDNGPAGALPASPSDTDGYSGTGNTAPSNQRRTLTLTNGEVIWDLAGNVNEWTQGTISGGQPGLSGESSFAWKNYSHSSLQWNNLPSVSRPTGALYSRSQGVGGLWSNPTNTSARAFLRGGYWSYGSNAGVLTLDLNRSPSHTYTNIGFRVAR